MLHCNVVTKKIKFIKKYMPLSKGHKNSRSHNYNEKSPNIWNHALIITFWEEISGIFKKYFYIWRRYKNLQETY